jgi:uncharacterized PurR-regulated membrane protein YhhQ (DUF165 family)
MFSFFLLALYVTVNVAAIGFLWYQGEDQKLKRLLFLMLLSALVFSGNIITVLGFSINIGVCHSLNYFLIGYVLREMYGSHGYMEVLKDHFHLLILVSIMSMPLAMMQTAGMVSSAIVAYPNLIDDILVDRVNYMVALAAVFYFGQLVYATSYEYIKQRSFWFEFLLRIPAVMTIQSVVFYIVQAMVSSEGLIHNGIILSKIVELVFSGLSVRLIALLLASLPFYWIYKNKKGIKKTNASS